VHAAGDDRDIVECVEGGGKNPTPSVLFPKKPWYLFCIFCVVSIFYFDQGKSQSVDIIVCQHLLLL